MVAALKIPVRMSADEFLVWAPSDHKRWQLVDGEPQAMAPPNRTHGAIQGELIRLIGNHLMERGSPCSVIGTPGIIPRVQSDINIRVPDLAVTCSGYQTEETAIADPILVVEILSPSNQTETWRNVWTYTTIPSVQEILIVRSATAGAELLRRNPDSTWPERPQAIEQGELALNSIDFRVPLTALYRTTRLARSGA
jgi:Uma2 family endonuclease